MRKLLVALLLTVSAAAQTVDPNEISFGPFIPGPRDPSIGLAGAPHGILLAYSELDPATNVSVIRTVLLNHDGRQIGEVNTLAPVRANWPATSPNVVTDGTTFFVGWIERDPYNYTPRSSSGVRTDPRGKPAEPTRHLKGAEPTVVWNGVDYELHETSLGRVPFATPQANGWVDWTQRVPGTYLSFGGSRPTRPFTIKWHILTADGVTEGVFADMNRFGSQPAVSAEGDDLLIIWRAGTALRGMRVVDGERKSLFEKDLDDISDPALAGSLVVFEKGGRIYGSLVDGDSFRAPFPISDGFGADSAPKVHHFGPDIYLVTWVRDHGPAVSFRARYVGTAR